MPIYNKLADGVDEVDIIIAGGGATGCVVAGRMASVDPDLSILVIEGGESNYMKEDVTNPIFFRDHLTPDSKTAVFYKCTKQPQLANREPVVPTGGLLGGGTSINMALYTRPQRSDFDSWNTEGWSANELLPYLKNFENFHAPGNPKLHGYDGPVHISDGGYRAGKPEVDVLQAAQKVGFPVYEDMQDLDSSNGWSEVFRYVSPEGRRQDAAHTFVHPLIQDGKHPNLHVLCGSKVHRVLFDENKRACGVEYGPNPDYQPSVGPSGDTKASVKAKKLVLLSCGACSTPSILERSGIGQKALLDQYNIPVIADVTGVGENYQDHNLVFYTYRTNLEEEDTADTIWSGRIPAEEAISKKMGILHWNAVDASSKIRPTDAEAKALGPEFEAAWDRDYKDAPDRPMMLMSLVSSFLGPHSLLEQGQYVTIGAYTTYPYARGSIHIRGPEWKDGVDFDLGFFTDKDDLDLKKQIWAYKKGREIMRRTKLYRGEVQLGHPVFPEGSPAACTNLSATQTNGVNGVNGADPSHDIKDIEYSEADNEAIIKYLRENITTTWHSLGTCKMAPLDKGGVVDRDLNVHGVTGLKVCDISIVPENVACNTMSVALMVGEKAASIICGELGLQEKDTVCNNELFKHSKLAYT